MPAPTLAEAAAFLEAARGNQATAAESMRRKEAWRVRQGRVTMRELAPFLRSEGYSVCLEGLCDDSGRPLIFANGALPQKLHVPLSGKSGNGAFRALEERSRQSRAFLRGQHHDAAVKKALRLSVEWKSDHPSFSKIRKATILLPM